MKFDEIKDRQVLLQTAKYRIVAETYEGDFPEKIDTVAAIPNTLTGEDIPDGCPVIKKRDYKKYPYHVGLCLDNHGWNDVIPNAAKDEEKGRGFYVATFCGTDESELLDYVKRWAAYLCSGAFNLVLESECSECGAAKVLSVSGPHYIIDRLTDCDSAVRAALEYFKEEGFDVSELWKELDKIEDK